jgi:hypothetical protein
MTTSGTLLRRGTVHRLWSVPQRRPYRPRRPTAWRISAIYLVNQGDVVATAVSGFPIFDLARLLSSTARGLRRLPGGGIVLPRRTRHVSRSPCEGA